MGNREIPPLVCLPPQSAIFHYVYLLEWQGEDIFLGLAAPHQITAFFVNTKHVLGNLSGNSTVVKSEMSKKEVFISMKEYKQFNVRKDIK